MAVSTVATAAVRLCSFSSPASVSLERSGVSPQRIITSPLPESCGTACITACPVPNCSSWIAYRTDRPNAASTSAAPWPITRILSVQRFSSVASTWPSKGRPQISWSTFGRSDFILFPSPAARITAVTSVISFPSLPVK